MAMEVRTFADENSFVASVGALIAGELASESATPRAVMLSGGRTPLAAYKALAQKPAPAAKNAWALFSDERMVPPDSPESNFGNAAGLLSAMDIREEHILRVRTDLPPAMAAERYHNDLAAFFSVGGRITLGLLGIGADGHTASLFSLADVERGADRWAIPVARTDGPDRVSVTAALIRRIDRIVFLVSGRDKAPVVACMLNDPGRIPAGKAVEGLSRVELWRI
ncbi:MAG TPA: 6-phosphogluconolactonase [Candidatus Hydrogenedentes bacterium]|nr:6-phosphogluconolactonase [Candidatus Hydrogenedentota bacterium]HRT64550.1 6-phosphogluconolactonase [Candidatus Hydrogenedentota bacterium]